MSSITLTPGFARSPRTRAAGASVRPGPSPESTLQLTRRGRLAVLFALLAGVLLAMVVMSGFATASLESGAPESVQIVQVQPGDTLYSIAAERAEDGEIRAMVQRIVELNSLPGGTLEAGQRLAIPKG